MKPQTEKFLNLVREAEQGSNEDAQRVHEKLVATLGIPADAAGSDGPAPNLPGDGGSTIAASKGLGLWTIGGGVVSAVAAVAVVSAVATTKPNETEVGHVSHQHVAAPTVAEPNLAEPPGSAPEREAAEGVEVAESKPEKIEQPSPQKKPSVKATPSPPSLRKELELLQEVQAALGRGDGAAALSLLDAHHTTDRQFLSERRAARVLSLCALGRTHEAKIAREQFLAHYPGSVHVEAIERACRGK